jgi:hypothetical protein
MATARTGFLMRVLLPGSIDTLCLRDVKRGLGKQGFCGQATQGL